MVDYDRIIKDCFWDLHITADMLDNIVQGDDLYQKKMLFEKILLNSTALFKDLRIFPENELAFLLENYQVPQFNHDYAFKRKNMAEVYFFNKPLMITELKWMI